MSEERYHITLTDLFEGPMDLLVHLIQKNEVNIYDVPISLITDQYLAYLEMLQQMNIDVAGEFLVMAATLTQIKSRLLLPDHSGTLEEGEDPRSEITGPLIEFMRMKTAAELLARRDLQRLGVFTRPDDPEKEYADREPSGELIQVGLFELIDAFKRILEKSGGEHRIDFTPERRSVKDRIRELVELLETRGSAAFHNLLPPGAGRAEIVITFLAVLEMVKMSLVRLSQHPETGTIHLFYQ